MLRYEIRTTAGTTATRMPRDDQERDSRTVNVVEKTTKRAPTTITPRGIHRLFSAAPILRDASRPPTARAIHVPKKAVVTMPLRRAAVRSSIVSPAMLRQVEPPPPNEKSQ